MAISVEYEGKTYYKQQDGWTDACGNKADGDTSVRLAVKRSRGIPDDAETTRIYERACRARAEGDNALAAKLAEEVLSQPGLSAQGAQGALSVLLVSIKRLSPGRDHSAERIIEAGHHWHMRHGDSALRGTAGLWLAMAYAEHAADILNDSGKPASAAGGPAAEAQKWFWHSLGDGAMDSVYKAFYRRLSQTCSLVGVSAGSPT